MREAPMTALQVSAAIRQKSLTVREAVDGAFAAIGERDGALNAWITLCPEQAKERAAQVQARMDTGRMDSPLAGVPVAIKDNLCTKGIKTSCASKILGDFTPCYSATAILRLQQAGGIVIGKTNMDEFAMGSTTETSCYGATKNPWNSERVAGGSSGGSAAAVAGGMVPIALGSDTGGSIRQPAAYCGLTGFKPTYGSVSRYGLIAYASSFDGIGVIARDAADCAAMTDCIRGKDPLDSTSVACEGGLLAALRGTDLSGLRVALPNQCFRHKGLSPHVGAAVQEAAAVLTGLGAVAEPVDLDFLDYVIPTYYIIAAAQASSNLSRYDGVRYGARAEGGLNPDELYRATRTEGFGDEVKRRILLGTFVLSGGYYDAFYKKALGMQARIKADFDALFRDYDLVLTPTTPATAPALGENLGDPLRMYLSDIFTVSANLAGLPAISVPCGFDPDGMPIGAQLMGARMGDDTVLRCAHAYQQVTEYHTHRPEAAR